MSAFGDLKPAGWTPATWAGTAAGLVLAAFAADAPTLPAALLAVELGLAAASGRLRSFVAVLAGVLAPVGLSLLVVHGLFHPGAAGITFGPLTVRPDGLLFALQTLSRLAVLTGAVLLVTLGLPPGRLLRDLTGRGVPPAVAYGLVAAVRFVPETRARARRIIAAQQTRGLALDGNPVRRLRALGALVRPLLLGMLAEAEARSVTLELRGFWVRRSRPAAEPAGERLLRWGALAAGALTLAIGRLSRL